MTEGPGCDEPTVSDIGDGSKVDVDPVMRQVAGGGESLRAGDGGRRHLRGRKGRGTGQALDDAALLVDANQQRRALAEGCRGLEPGDQGCRP